MDIYYEESAVCSDSVKAQRRYTIVHIISIVALIIGAICAIVALLNIPFGSIGDGLTEAQQQELIAYRNFFIFVGIQGAFFILLWYILHRLKQRINVNYDYIFVSGEIRISKVFNVNHRKLITRIQPEQIIQLGDIDNGNYERLKADSSVKEIICTSNSEAAKGKFFMYILIGEAGEKQLYVLECREEMLVNILKFVKRSTLEKEYIPQEKKNGNLS